MNMMINIISKIIAPTAKGSALGSARAEALVARWTLAGDLIQ